MAADDHPVHLIRTVGKAQVADVMVQFGERVEGRKEGGVVKMEGRGEDLEG